MKICKECQGKDATIKAITRSLRDGTASDGYHTFQELYRHRCALFIALCRLTDLPCWRSRHHFDGSAYPGWFIMGIGTRRGHQISYHLPIEKWGETEFAVTRRRAPRWDGHTSDDVVERLGKLEAD